MNAQVGCTLTQLESRWWRRWQSPCTGLQSTHRQSSRAAERPLQDPRCHSLLSHWLMHCVEKGGEWRSWKRRKACKDEENNKPQFTRQTATIKEWCEMKNRTWEKVTIALEHVRRRGRSSHQSGKDQQKHETKRRREVKSRGQQHSARPTRGLTHTPKQISASDDTIRYVGAPHSQCIQTIVLIMRRKESRAASQMPENHWKQQQRNQNKKSEQKERRRERETRKRNTPRTTRYRQH